MKLYVLRTVHRSTYTTNALIHNIFNGLMEAFLNSFIRVLRVGSLAIYEKRIKER